MDPGARRAGGVSGRAAVRGGGAPPGAPGGARRPAAGWGSGGAAPPGGPPPPPAEYTHWDVGRWRDEGDGRLALSTANDAVVAYRYRLEGGRLEFEAPDGARFAYRRR